MPKASVASPENRHQVLGDEGPELSADFPEEMQDSDARAGVQSGLLSRELLAQIAALHRKLDAIQDRDAQRFG